MESWSPDLILFVDSEIWPNFLLEIKKKNIPLIVLNGRKINYNNILVASRDDGSRESNNSHLVVFNHILRTVLLRSNGCLTIGNQVRYTLPVAVKCNCCILYNYANNYNSKEELCTKTEQDATNIILSEWSEGLT